MFYVNDNKIATMIADVLSQLPSSLRLQPASQLPTIEKLRIRRVGNAAFARLQPIATSADVLGNVNGYNLLLFSENACVPLHCFFAAFVHPKDMSSCVIEEILPEDDPTRFDDQLERILIAHQQDGKAFLATCFDFLNRKTAFFKDPNVSKTLARLLRDVKQSGQPAKSSIPLAPSIAAPINGSSKVRSFVTACKQTCALDVWRKHDQV